MKDTKITKENYKQLFECAGFEKTEFNGWSRESNTEVFCETGLIKLAPLVDGDGVLGVIATFCHHEYTIHLNEAARSTKDLDDAFRIFLDKPLVWQKKWDFDSVFDRMSKEATLPNKAIEVAIKCSLYEHENPRVQAFSRLLFVMNELNKEYQGSRVLVSEVIRGGGYSLCVCSDRSNQDVEGCLVFNSSVAANLFLRDNEADLKTFFNI